MNNVVRFKHLLWVFIGWCVMITFVYGAATKYADSGDNGIKRYVDSNYVSKQDTVITQQKVIIKYQIRIDSILTVIIKNKRDEKGNTKFKIN